MKQLFFLLSNFWISDKRGGFLYENGGFEDESRDVACRVSTVRRYMTGSHRVKRTANPFSKNPLLCGHSLKALLQHLQ